MTVHFCTFGDESQKVSQAMGSIKSDAKLDQIKRIGSPAVGCFFGGSFLS